MLPRWTAFLKKRTTPTTILSELMKISSCKGERDFLFFADSLTVMLSFGFQTTIIIVGQRFLANPTGEREADGL